MPRKKSVRKKNVSGIAKIASFTATSISNAYSTYKKKQDQRKVEEIKLKTLLTSYPQEILLLIM